MSARVVFCTVPDEAVAAELARGLVHERLAACVNVVPGLRSFYWWQGEVQDDAELLLIIKTSEDRALSAWGQFLAAGVISVVGLVGVGVAIAMVAGWAVGRGGGAGGGKAGIEKNVGNSIFGPFWPKKTKKITQNGPKHSFSQLCGQSTHQ